MTKQVKKFNATFEEIQAVVERNTAADKKQGKGAGKNVENELKFKDYQKIMKKLTNQCTEEFEGRRFEVEKVAYSLDTASGEVPELVLAVTLRDP